MLGLPSVHGLQVAVKQLVSAEDSEACAVLLTDGTVYTWGFNAYGELGDGTTTERNSPVPVPGLTAITQLAAGDNHSLALRSDGTVLSWGRNDYGELGNGTTTSRSTPGPVPGLTGIIQVAAAGDVSYALRSDGTLYAWGGGILGAGTNTVNPAPVTVPLAGVTQVATGGADTLAIAGPKSLDTAPTICFIQPNGSELIG